MGVCYVNTHMNRSVDIQAKIDAGLTLQQIGESLGISRQRVYQLMTQYRISLPSNRRKNFWRDQPDKAKWLRRVLIAKNQLHLFDCLANEMPDTCPILGVPLNYAGGSPRDRDYSPSIDRIDSSRGYNSGNVHVISWRANRIKNDSTPDELLKIAIYMQKLTNDDSTS